MEGFLIKEGGAIKTWKKRWCILNDGILAYQTKKVWPYAGLPVVDIETINLCLVPNQQGAPLKGQLDMKTVEDIQPVRYKKKNCFEVHTPGRIYYFSADSRQLVNQWIDALRRSRDTLHGIAPSKPPKAFSKAHVNDFQALCVIGRGSFGKVCL